MEWNKEAWGDVAKNIAENGTKQLVDEIEKIEDMLVERNKLLMDVEGR